MKKILLPLTLGLTKAVGAINKSQELLKSFITSYERSKLKDEDPENIFGLIKTVVPFVSGVQDIADGVQEHNGWKIAERAGWVALGALTFGDDGGARAGKLVKSVEKTVEIAEDGESVTKALAQGVEELKKARINCFIEGTLIMAGLANHLTNSI